MLGQLDKPPEVTEVEQQRVRMKTKRGQRMKKFSGENDFIN